MQLHRFFEEIRREEGVSVRLLAARAGVSEEEMADYLAHGPYLRAASKTGWQTPSACPQGRTRRCGWRRTTARRQKGGGPR